MDKRVEYLRRLGSGTQGTAPVLAVDMDDAWALALRADSNSASKPQGTDVRWTDLTLGDAVVGVYWHVLGEAAADVFARVESAARDRVVAHEYLVPVADVPFARWALVARDLVTASAARVGVDAHPAHPYRERHADMQYYRWQVGLSTVTVAFSGGEAHLLEDLVAACRDGDAARVADIGRGPVLLTQHEYLRLLSSAPDLQGEVAWRTPDAGDPLLLQRAVSDALRAIDAVVDAVATSADGAPLSGLAADVERLALVPSLMRAGDEDGLCDLLRPLLHCASKEAARRAAGLVESLAEAGYQRAAALAMDLRMVWRWRLAP